MFEFLTRRHAAPAEMPLSEVRFTREDLFVLMGGSDTGMFAADDDTIDFGRLEREGMDAWRRDMAARLSPTGLVDAEGAPSDELAEALYPPEQAGYRRQRRAPPPAPRREGAQDRVGRVLRRVRHRHQGAAGQKGRVPPCPACGGRLGRGV